MMQNVIHKSLSYMRICSVALLLEVVPIMFYIEQQWTMKLSLAAASTLYNSFYVDDLLKSVGYINITKKLVKDVISMRKSGGFNLAKFASNSMELLQSIPK